MCVCVCVLTEVLEGLLYLFSGEVQAGVWGDERGVQPVVVVIAINGVRSQLIVGQLLLQQTDDFHLWKISAVTHIWTGKRRKRKRKMGKKRRGG